jgi:hypothetical protein
MISRYEVVIDWANGHKIINKDTRNEHFITGSELTDYMDYSLLQIRENMSFSNAIHHIDNYLQDLII